METTRSATPFRHPTIAMAAPPASSAPASPSAGYYAEWHIQARFFRDGTPVGNNTHYRRFDFGREGFVDIQAHVPVLTYSDGAKLAAVGRFFVAVGAGAAVGALTCQPVGLVIGAVWGTVAGAAVIAATAPPPDAIWQGYTARYFSREDPKHPWGVRHFYGWSDPDTPLQAQPGMAGGGALLRMHDLAEREAGYSWWSWRTGDAPIRPATPPANLQADVQPLVQAMAGFATHFSPMDGETAGIALVWTGATAPPLARAST